MKKQLEKFKNISNDKYALKTLAHITIGLCMFIGTQLIIYTCQNLINSEEYQQWNTPVSYLLNIGGILLFYWILRLYIVKFLRLPMKFFNIPKLGAKGIWVAAAILLPTIVALFYLFATPGSLRVEDQASIGSITKHLIDSLLYVGLTAGIMEELLFRGFTMKLVENRWGKNAAIFAPSLLFGILHMMGGMGAVDIILLLIAGTSVGVMFSMVTYQSNSIWNAALIHTIWNTFSLGSILKIGNNISCKEMFMCYKLDSENFLLTGGEFGIEAALPATAGYLLVTLLALALTKKANKLRT